MAGLTTTSTTGWGGNVPNTTLESAQFNIVGTYDVTHVSGTTTTVSDLYIYDIVTFAADGAALATFATDNYVYVDGGELTLSEAGGAGDVKLDVDDLLRAENGGTFSVLQGSDVITGHLDLGASSGDGMMIIDGAGSSLKVNSSTDLGYAGGTGTLTFQNGSTSNNLIGTVDLMAFSGVAGSTGRLNVLDGSSLQTGSIKIGKSSSTSAVQEGTLTINGGGSTLTMTGASTLTVGDDVNPNVGSDVKITFGTLYIGGYDLSAIAGTAEVIAQHNAEITAGNIKVWQYGTITLIDSTLNSGFIELDGGTLEGNGTVIASGALNNGGTVMPRSTLAVEGIYHQLVNGTLDVELWGTAPGDFGSLDITGQANLGGMLKISLGTGHTPAIGDYYELISTTTGVFGRFEHVQFPTLSGTGLGLSYANPILVSALVGLIGDLNLDGFVGIEDLNIVLSVWNQNVTAGDIFQGDPSGDGFVGIEDLNVVLSNWNAGTPPKDTANIPEPGSLAMLLLSGTAVVYRGMRRS